MIDTLRENALDELVTEKINKAEQAPVSYNIKAGSKLFQPVLKIKKKEVK